MGMPGMTNEAATAYAVAGTKVREQQAETSSPKMTVAEFRNKTNHITHYYDSYLFDSFIKDQSIVAKDKLAVVFGQFVVDALYDTGDVNADMLAKLMKTMIDNAKEMK